MEGWTGPGERERLGHELGLVVMNGKRKTGLSHHRRGLQGQAASSQPDES